MRKLRSKKYFIFIGLIASLLIASHIYLQLTLSNSFTDASIINTAGRQRMLSQKIMKLLLQMNLSKDSIQYQQKKIELEKTSATWKQSHTQLKTLAKSFNDIKTDSLFNEIEPYFLRLNKSISSIREERYFSMNSLSKHTKIISENEIHFLSLMDQITFRLEHLATEKIKRMSSIEYFLLIATLILILSQVFYVFLPLLKIFKSKEDTHIDLLKMIDEINGFAIIGLDLDGNIKNWNTGAENLTGYSSEEIRGKKFSVLSIKKDRTNKKPLQLLRKPDDNGIATIDRLIVRKQKSTFWASLTTTVVYNNVKEVIGYKLMIRDISTQKKAQKIKVLEIKNKELEQFTYIASHDLKEPLRTISNYIQVIKEDYGSTLDKELMGYLTSINDASKRMSELVHSLLDYSQLGKSSKLTSVDCQKVIDSILQDIKTSIDTTKSTFEIDQLPNLMGFPTELRQLFQNLITNAIKFSKKERPPHIVIQCQSRELDWRFSVSDNGIGIDEMHFDKIFKIFRRAQHVADFEGQGIGLANCKKIAELHEGTIWVDSQIDQGSTFYFTISKNI